MRLLFAREHCDPLATDALGGRDELRPVPGIAARRGRDTPNLLHAADVAERAEAEQRFKRLLNRIGGKQARRLHLATKAREHFLVEDRGWRAGQPLVDHEAHRVGTDVDDGIGRAVMQAPLREIQRPGSKRARGGA